ncbi:MULTISPECIES: GtrA family protein [Methylosinus]|uniref:GtrA family protein n=1 Tax=Methylosinus trichosporium (strain ATCC 35070 / NCIMB 11131 / UNIQEM 75 / OB3b) TaxID=595536 RepID=A0A2D2D695_METT3|nr:MULTISPECIES: GtrA family protein [Methylosinus]ATQ70485.1 GtrA family protein [Methylosinus trichosporium OB3b]OBS51265.1 polysaccharide synthesis protein GtrA [Methylosinus sp. 3S-1]
MSLRRQITVFALVGVVATLLHYVVLIALVELAERPPVMAALCGYVVGGIVSYGLNRRHTFASDRPHEEATWRFALVAFVGFCLTYLFMDVFVARLGAPYLPAQMATTGVVFFWSFVANRLWTFRPAE